MVGSSKLRWDLTVLVQCHTLTSLRVKYTSLLLTLREAGVLLYGDVVVRR